MDTRASKRKSSGRNILPHYKFGKTLGSGTFAEVKLAVHTLTGLNVAIKILNRQSLDNTEAEKMRREINIMRQLCHPHVVRLFEVIDTPSKVYIVMEYMSSGELFEYLIENKLHEDEARHIFQQIISGVEYCHGHMVVHRDLKLENLLLDSEHNVKIADFGLGNSMRDGYFLKTSCGSPNYAAPEIIKGQLYAGPEVDVWSCGIILYALLCGRLPFEDESIPGVCAKIRSGIYRPIVRHLSESARDLISRIIVLDPMKRISIREIRLHPWFQKNLPPYVSIPSHGVFNRREEVDMNIVNDMNKLGFDVKEVIRSLQNHVKNEATVTYSMLLHSRSPGHISHNNENLEALECMDHLQTYLQSDSLGKNYWTLGFNSRARPRETMLWVLKVFHRLNVKWKRIGIYNMKCLWVPPLSRCSLSTTETHISRSSDAIKFEIQLYKASGELYVLDLQLLSGAPFIFLEICAAFRALVV
ncbi:hypothetical protein ACJIZ3_025726 [Penstemon smallii]|uniref:non-specific serine/threonine protein kinase n=1 Tax=Penstemon smallii TaxID=265156 RepID=A0ABD3TY13_9LAMI